MVGIVLSIFFSFFAFVLIRFLIRKQSSPHRPTLTLFLDSLFEIFSILKIGPWSNEPDIHTGLKIALKSTKLNDLGDYNDFVKRYDITRKEGLRQLNAKFSPAGHYFLLQSLEKRIEVRLRYFDYLKKHPKIKNIKVNSPVFVIGFPRTGTTFLHEMLTLNENVRAHYTWEQLNPIPLTDSEDRHALMEDRLKRYNDNKSHFNFLFKYIISESIQHIHRIGYDEPEECTIPCSIELPWALSEIPLHIFAIDKLIPMGAGNTFKLYRDFLKIMTFQSDDRYEQDFTWMLKCPFHLPYLDDLHKEFPDATIVWTHRDPAECIASACSLYETILRMAMEEYSLDPNLIGKAVMHYTRISLDCAEKTIQRLGDKFKIIHVRYADNVKNSHKICKSVFSKANIPFDSRYDDKVNEYLRVSNEQRNALKAKKGSVHKYRPEDYGLTTQQIHEEFADYIKKYDLLEKK